MTTPERRLSPDAARRLTLSTEPWLSCEDCFDLMDVYVETLLADPGGPALPAMPELEAMHVHLRGCAACAEEVRSLLELVADQDGRAAGPALSRLP